MLVADDWTSVTQVCTELDRSIENTLTESESNIDEVEVHPSLERGSPSSSDHGWMSMKRPKLDQDSSSFEGGVCDPKTSVEKEQGQEVSISDVGGIEECGNESGGEESRSGSGYRETTLDKLMDCLTQFKYSLLRLHSCQLLVQDPSTASIISSLEQLEDLYEAMAK